VIEKYLTNHVVSKPHAEDRKLGKRAMEVIVTFG
jgi:hypothetical protein